MGSLVHTITIKGSHDGAENEARSDRISPHLFNACQLLDFGLTIQGDFKFSLQGISTSYASVYEK
jgi:hypothetical protein